MVNRTWAVTTTIPDWLEATLSTVPLVTGHVLVVTQEPMPMELLWDIGSHGTRHVKLRLSCLLSVDLAFWRLNHHLREGGSTQRDALLQRFLQCCTAGNFLFLPCIFLSESDATCGLGWCCESQCWMTLTRQRGGVCRKPCDMLCHLCNWEGSAFLPLGRNLCCHNTCRPSTVHHVSLSTPC